MVLSSSSTLSKDPCINPKRVASRALNRSPKDMNVVAVGCAMRQLWRMCTGQEVTRAVPSADLHHHEWRDHSRDETQLDFGEAKHSLVNLDRCFTLRDPHKSQSRQTNRECKVTSGNKTRSAANGIAVDAADDRLGAPVDGIEHGKKVTSVFFVFLLLQGGERDQDRVKTRGEKGEKQRDRHLSVARHLFHPVQVGTSREGATIARKNNCTILEP